MTIPTLNKAEEVSANEFPLVFSARAIEIAKSALAENAGEDGEFLRVSIEGGGCAGMQYALNFVDQATKFDLSTDLGGLKVVADMFSLAHLRNTAIDYEESLQGAGFKFNNPNAKKTCGCGSSFS